MKYLIHFRKDWADEFECEQFVLEEFSSIQKVRKYIHTICDEEGHGFGTNQGWEEGEVNPNDFRTRELSDSEWDTMIKLFPSKRFGLGVMW